MKEKYMKYIGLSVFLLILAIAYVYDHNYSESIEDIVYKWNRELPIVMGNGEGQLTSCKVKDNFIVLRCDYKDKYIDIDAINSNIEDSKDILFFAILGLRAQGRHIDEVLDLIISKKMGIRFVFADNFGRSAFIEMSADYINDKRQRLKISPTEAIYWALSNIHI